MADWRVARGLDRLRDQVNEIAPRRSKLSDGSIGDPAHHKQRSDHNPDSLGVVRARDITHDPAHGADMHEIAEQLRLSRDRRISYVIWNRRIFSGAAGPSPWVWRAYSGDNPHDKHMHVSVVASALADDTSEWRIAMPLTNEEIERISDRSAAKVLGRAWAAPGRTLAGSVEALIAMVQAGTPASATAEVKALVAQVLAEVSQDPTVEVTIPPAVGDQIADRVVDRLHIPTAAENAQAVISEIAS